MPGANYLIGNGHRLVSGIKLPSNYREPKPIYTFDEAYNNTFDQWLSVQTESQSLPRDACPKGQTVFALTLHPNYLAMSHYPGTLFRELGINAIGSKFKSTVPHKPRHKMLPDQADMAPEYFIAVERQRLPDIVGQLSELSLDSRKQFAKIESVRTLGMERIKVPDSAKTKQLVWEAVLQGEEDYVPEGFDHYLSSLEVKANWNQYFNIGGLWFVSLRASTSKVIEGVSLFSFLRVIRPMPSLRPVDYILRQARTGRVFLPSEQALDDQVKAAILDGGLPSNHGLETWVNLREPPDIGSPVPEGLAHGLAVTSAFLFGPLSGGVIADIPPCRIDHWRVMDREDHLSSEPGLYNVLQRIKDILDQNAYRLVNISLGPDLPVEDDEPHAWTAVLDSRLEDGSTLLCSAVGNGGEQDWASDNARVQPPSDTVNGLGIGASDRRDSSWQRATYSCIGPGRRPGYVKPDLIAFGGSHEEPFGVITPSGRLGWLQGTSFSSPYAGRMAMNIASFFQTSLNAVALKALLIHQADANGHDSREVGWGKLPDNISDLITSDDHQAHILYQGVLGDRAGWRLPVPLPHTDIPGIVTIRTTICFASSVDTSHPLSYTQAGLDVVFRPDPINEPSATKSYFKGHDYWPHELALRQKAMKWEPVLKAERGFRGQTLKSPVFDLHYLVREGGHKAGKRPDLPYAAVITVTARRVADLYNQIINQYRQQLMPLRPRQQVQHRLRV